MTLNEGESGDQSSESWCTKCNESKAILAVPTLEPPFNLPTRCLGHNFCRQCGCKLTHTESKEEVKFETVNQGDVNSNESGLFLYLDLHGHASKKGVFMYGNHFDDLERRVECMLLPKLMGLNNHHFHFQGCNFTERNMYLRWVFLCIEYLTEKINYFWFYLDFRDKRDGMSRAGSGRVAVLSLTGIIKSYTLECNYNTGRFVNVLPPTVKKNSGKMQTLPVPPKYNPQIFEEVLGWVGYKLIWMFSMTKFAPLGFSAPSYIQNKFFQVGRSLGASILDMTGQNPFSRLPNSEFHSLTGLREWLRTSCCSNNFGDARPKLSRMRSSPVQIQVGQLDNNCDVPVSITNCTLS